MSTTKLRSLHRIEYVDAAKAQLPRVLDVRNRQLRWREGKPQQTEQRVQ